MRNKMILLFTLLFAAINLNAQTYDLESFLNLVKQNNKDIMLAAKDLEISETQDAMTRAAAYPNISAKAGYNRNLNEAYMYFNANDLNPEAPNVTSKFKINYNNEFNGQAVVSQQIFNFSVFNAIKAAKQYEELSSHVYDATEKAIINGSKKAFYQTLLLNEVWQVNKESEKNAHENYLNMKKKYEVGLASELQMLQAEVRWQNLIPNLTQSERNYQLALNSLKSLAGINVEENFEIVGKLQDIDIKASKMEMVDILNNRPDYNAKLWERKLRESNVNVEFSSHLPTLAASFVYQYSALSDEFKLERENNYLIAGLSLNIPIFSGWGTSARVQKAEIELNKADLELNKMEDQIFIEINNLELKLTESEKRINSAESTLNIAKKAFNIAEITSDNGLSTQLELKDARLAYDQAQLNYYVATYEYLEAYFDWELAVGLTK
ncbi:MAG: TolC family protein [Ignavibacteriales bacterium]|nr:TolC family protein [Ignavibacteriales bacterium]MCB9218208.1 TolC family protein [Ignavibacteriales bacterium]MCB9260709.1 TolC family protein [Ignavibacteriales bacterium]